MEMILPAKILMNAVYPEMSNLTAESIHHFLMLVFHSTIQIPTRQPFKQDSLLTIKLSAIVKMIIMVITWLKEKKLMLIIPILAGYY